jgi:RNA recognition motif-containing protein
MVKKLYVGNLIPKVTEDEVRNLFEQYGEVHSVKLIMDWETGNCRGFGFIEMGHDEAQNAMTALNGKEFMGLDLKVDEARDRRSKRKPGRRSNGFSGGGRRYR